MAVLGAAKKVILTNKEYTLEQVRDILNEQGGLPCEAVIGGMGLSKGVYLPTKKHFIKSRFDVYLRVKKNEIMVTLNEMPSMGGIIGGAVGGIAGAAAGDAIGGKRKGAGSWEEYLGVEKYNKNDPVFAVAAKVQELFGA